MVTLQIEFPNWDILNDEAKKEEIQLADAAVSDFYERTRQKCLSVEAKVNNLVSIPDIDGMSVVYDEQDDDTYLEIYTQGTSLAKVAVHQVMKIGMNSCGQIYIIAH